MQRNGPSKDKVESPISKMETGETLTLEQWLHMLPEQAIPVQERVLCVQKCA